jgi:hypothetical protein
MDGLSRQAHFQGNLSRRLGMDQGAPNDVPAADPPGVGTTPEARVNLLAPQVLYYFCDSLHLLILALVCSHAFSLPFLPF